MKVNLMKSLATTTLLGAMALTNVYAETAKSVGKTEGVMATSKEVTATVKNVDYKTRKVTLMTPDGKTQDIVASEDIKNLPQLKKGDLVTATYSEALVYNINKGGKASDPVVSATAETARPGAKPGASVASQVKMTVIISEINRQAPSVTFKAADGETQTFKVRHPEKLEGVKVGDAVDITYSEALALKVEKKQAMTSP
jgi:Cu/Ag efflux protein CusF